MNLQTASIAQHAKSLRLAAVGAQFAALAEEAAQRNHSHLHYLEALLQAELEDRERRSIELRMQEAHLPRIKTLEEFDFTQSPQIPAARIRALAEGGYLERAEPVLLVGEPIEHCFAEPCVVKTWGHSEKGRLVVTMTAAFSALSAMTWKSSSAATSAKGT